jgi:hypothetical protein
MGETLVSRPRRTDRRHRPLEGADDVGGAAVLDDPFGVPDVGVAVGSFDVFAVEAPPRPAHLVLGQTVDLAQHGVAVEVRSGQEQVAGVGGVG